MASSLAAQLAQIAANSRSSLNVKAQKAAHGKSLIFEPRVATSQSFQTVYAACRDGFEELCQLDSRFTQFATTLFSEQSQDEDRTQMTAAENAELDRLVESFLRLAGSRLRLMPAIKAVEWLIRRFRIHELNTSILVSTFLPYHTIPAFVTLMSILPSNIPNDFRFLAPYIRSLTAPPRAAIVHQATHHPEFLDIITEYTLESCRNQQHYPALLSFWGGLMTEAVNGIIDTNRSGRKGVQLDNDIALLQRIGPPVGEALVMKKVPGAQIAAYMVVALLAAKGNFEDKALSAFMEQLVFGWTADTLRPGLVCLSILAQHRSAKQLSAKVAKAMLKIDDLSRLLLDISAENRVDKLANGLVLALIDRLSKKGDARGLPTIKSILLTGLLQDKQVAVAFKALLVAAHKIDDEMDEDGTARKQLGSALVALSQSAGAVGTTVRGVIEEADFDIEDLELKLDTSFGPKLLLEPPASGDVTDGDTKPAEEPAESLDAALGRLSALPRSVPSFLSQSSDDLFDKICRVFLSVAASPHDLLRFDEASFLGHKTATDDSYYFGFYMRVWCGPYPTLLRATALDMTKRRLKQDDCKGIDFQAMIPYCIAALHDPAKKVRRVAADLLVVLGSLAPENMADTSKKKRWASSRLYEQLDELKWMKPQSARSLLHTVLIPALEESILHEGHIALVLKDHLDVASRTSTSASGNERVAHLSSAIKSDIMIFLSSHVVYTPLLAVKSRILKSLNQVQVRGSQGPSRTQMLLPLLQWWASLSQPEASSLCAREGLEEKAFDTDCVEVVVANDKQGLDCLFGILSDPNRRGRESLVEASFARLKKLWPSMKGDTKIDLARRMLDLAHGPSAARPGREVIAEEAADFLRSVELTSRILVLFLESLQDIAQLTLDSPATKRRRTSASEHSRGAAVQVTSELKATLNKVTFVLQLVEGSNPAEHPELLQSLFMTLADLQVLRALVGSELGYLQNLVLSSLLAMMPTYKNNKELTIDTSVGHGDVLVQCIQKSSSPAVQNSALLLVASLANTAPEVVLHSVMPIFTFMGGSVLRQGDDYSAHVVTQTIREVVPPLIETFRKSRRNPVASAAELLSSFVIAYEHIPSHRKHAMFISLVENLGPHDFLFALVAMLVDKYGTTDSIIGFSAELMNSFGVEVQLHSLVMLLDLVSDIFQPRPGLSVALLGKNDDGEMDLQKSALKELILLPRLLSSRRLRDGVSQMAERDDMEATKIRDLYSALLEKLLTLAETVKGKKALHERCSDALSSLLNLLPIAEFIKAVENLLHRPNVSLRQKVLQALEVRVEQESSTAADPKSRAALLAFLPQLTSVIRDSDDTRYKHTAVACVDKISEKYGKKDIETVAAAASTIAGDWCLGQKDQKLRIMALLCLASLVGVLQDAIVPVLPVAFPKALSYLEESLGTDGAEPDAELHNAVFSFVSSLAHHLPYLMTESYIGRLLASANMSAEAGLDAKSNLNRQNCFQLLAAQVDAKVMFASMERNWDQAVASGLSAVEEYMRLLGSVIDHHPKAIVTKNVGTLSGIFLRALDLRRQIQSKDTVSISALTKLTQIEGLVNEVALKMIYKLNDATFRPVFTKLMEWLSSGEGLAKKDSAGRTLRRQSAYGFFLVFFGNLKSIVTNYGSYVVDDAVSVLQTAKPAVDMEDRELWKLVLRTLASCFQHDQDGFWQAPSHFEAVAPILTSQFELAPSLDLKEELIPALVELAAATADSQEHQKTINSAVLRHLRSPHASIRLAAVLAQQELTDRLGEDWLSMLPEMLPCISELQDDDDEVVDRETHRWIVKIEGVLGESLDSMLQ